MFSFNWNQNLSWYFELGCNCHPNSLSSESKLSTIGFGGPNRPSLVLGEQNMNEQKDSSINARRYRKRYLTCRATVTYIINWFPPSSTHQKNQSAYRKYFSLPLYFPFRNLPKIWIKTLNWAVKCKNPIIFTTPNLTSNLTASHV